MKCCAWGRCSKAWGGTIWNLSRSSGEHFSEHQLFSQHGSEWVPLSKTRFMASTITQASDLWVICNTDIKIGFVLTQGIFLQIYKNNSAWQGIFFFLRDKFQWAGAGDNRSNFPQKRMLQMLDSRPARTWPQLTSCFSDRMVWVGELNKKRACVLLLNVDSLKKQQHLNDKFFKSRPPPSLFAPVSSFAFSSYKHVLYIGRTKVNKEGRKEINITGCQPWARHSAEHSHSMHHNSVRNTWTTAPTDEEVGAHKGQNVCLSATTLSGAKPGFKSAGLAPCSAILFKIPLSSPSKDPFEYL